MCGINVIVSKDKNKDKLIKKMNDKIIHRGPDASGEYVDDYVALGQRRLSIIDLEGGIQPMYNEDKSLVIIFNIGIFINYSIYMSNVGMEVFLYNDISDEEKTKINEYIKNSEINDYSYKSKEDALEQMKENMGENAYMLNDYNGSNSIFPESFVVNASKKTIDKMSEYLMKMDGVKRITTQTSYNPYEIFIISIMKK